MQWIATILSRSTANYSVTAKGLPLSVMITFAAPLMRTACTMAFGELPASALRATSSAPRRTNVPLG